MSQLQRQTFEEENTGIVPAFTFGPFIILILLILNIIYIKHFCLKKRKNGALRKQQDIRFQLMLLGCLLLSLIYMIGTFIFNEILPIFFIGYTSKWGCFMKTSWVLLIGLQKVLMHSFFLIRLYLTFKGSIVEINKKLIIIMFIYIITTTLGFGITYVTLSFFVQQYWCENTDIPVLSTVAYIGNFNDFLWFIVINFMYIIKLYQFIKTININDADKDNKMFEIVKKLTVLAVVAGITTILLISLLAPWRLWGSEYGGADLTVNCICMMLSFADFNKSYQRCCCCCIKLCCYYCDRNKKNDAIEMVKNMQLHSETISD